MNLARRRVVLPVDFVLPVIRDLGVGRSVAGALGLGALNAVEAGRLGGIFWVGDVVWYTWTRIAVSGTAVCSTRPEA